MDSGVEIEAKFNVSDLNEIRRRLLKQGGQVVVPRHLEHNLYYDTSDRRLRFEKKILRIRTGTDCRMTYKHQAGSFEARREIELALDDPAEAQAMLQALGYEMILNYGKMRETYELEDVYAMLDELPFGQFVEIEGPTIEKVQSASASLGLDWKKRSKVGYLVLFEEACDQLDVPMHEVSFDAVSRHHPIRSVDLGLVDATLTEKPSRIKK
jgi:adenylate cyclase class 2